MNESRSDYDWIWIQKLRLDLGLVTRDDYHQILAENSFVVEETVTVYPLENPTVFYIQDLHQFLFERLHPWAGGFRRLIDSQVVATVYPDADAKRIPRS